MTSYIVRRLLLMIPTLFGIMLASFVIVQLAPGGPVEQVIARMSGLGQNAGFVLGTESDSLPVGSKEHASTSPSKYRGAQGLDPEFIAALERQFGFDKPVHERFFLLLGNYLRFDFGTSYFRDISVLDLIWEKLPVSISLGLWSTLLTYGISIPFGIRKAVRSGTSFDLWTSVIFVSAYAIPGFLLALLLIIFFAGGSFFHWFPLRGLTSNGWEDLSLLSKIADYFWHMTLPLISLTVSSLAVVTLLVKNSFLEEIRKQYVLTARARGICERDILYKHIFRNAMLVVIAGFPGVFIGSFFTGSLLIETIFSLDGLGLLSFEAITNRDYPVVFASLYIFSLLGILLNLISDLTYTWVDPRITFEKQGEKI